ncbi:hypothetical protein [Luteolibacter sp. AS25]|uniref:hypothetical protein n=1 Tax=Luteolibacter sp. AS25 TaxID=3135776 RepID=UPI00398AEC0D
MGKKIMQVDQTNLKTITPHFGIAAVFALGGLVVCIPFGLVLWYFANMASWGDGSTGNAIGNPTLVAILLILPLALYFVLGFAAAISTNQRVRNILYVLATVLIIIISLVLGIAILATFPLAIVGILAIAVAFSVILSRLVVEAPKKAEQGGDGDAEPAVRSNLSFSPARHSFNVSGLGLESTLILK